MQGHVDQLAEARLTVPRAPSCVTCVRIECFSVSMQGPTGAERDDEPLPERPSSRQLRDFLLKKLKGLQEDKKVLDVTLTILEDAQIKHYALQKLGLHSPDRSLAKSFPCLCRFPNLSV